MMSNLSEKRVTQNNLEPDFTRTRFYTVESGDTLRSISKKFLGDHENYRKIMELNGLTNPRIFAGQILRIPESIDSGVISYRVKKNDTLWSISKLFLGNGNRYGEIMTLNGLTSDMIYPGQILKISIDESVSPKTYIVKPGDTLWKISQEFLGDGKRYTEIIKLNNLESGDLRVGQNLNLPIK